MVKISASACILSPIPENINIGPFAQVEIDVQLGTNITLDAFCHVYSGVTLGTGVHLFDGALIGNKPQDLKYQGEVTQTFIGAGTQIREYVTVNKGTRATGFTKVGIDCLLMAYTHVAHDCVIGDRVVLANAVQMGGHVRIGSDTVISGLTGIHQFVTIGIGCFVGGGLRVDKDLLPFTKALGEPLRYAGINEMGLRKLGYGTNEAAILKLLYRYLFAQGKIKTLLEINTLAVDHSWQGLPKTLLQIIVDFLGEQKRIILMRENYIPERIKGSDDSL